MALCLKISQSEWIERLKTGEAWFGKIDNYIQQAINSGNEEQGDSYEGIFARCKNDSPLIEKCKTQLADDLEIISDGKYSILRRKTCRLQKAFCMYGIKNSDFEIIEPIKTDKENYTGTVKYNINPRMYENFTGWNKSRECGWILL